MKIRKKKKGNSLSHFLMSFGVDDLIADVGIDKTSVNLSPGKEIFLFHIF